MPWPLSSFGIAVAVDEVVAAHEAARPEVRRAPEAAAVRVGDAGVEHRDVDAPAARAGRRAIRLSQASRRVDAAPARKFHCSGLPAAGRAARAGVVRDEGRAARCSSARRSHARPAPQRDRRRATRRRRGSAARACGGATTRGRAAPASRGDGARRPRPACVGEADDHLAGARASAAAAPAGSGARPATRQAVRTRQRRSIARVGHLSAARKFPGSHHRHLNVLDAAKHGAVTASSTRRALHAAGPRARRELALEHDDVPVGAVVVRGRRGPRRRAQRARAAPGPDGARRGARAARGRRAARHAGGSWTRRSTSRSSRARCARARSCSAASRASSTGARPEGGRRGQRARRPGRAALQPPPAVVGRLLRDGVRGARSSTSSPPAAERRSPIPFAADAREETGPQGHAIGGYARRPRPRARSIPA